MKLRPILWKFKNLITTQFYVKSILPKSQTTKLPFLQFQRLWTLNFGKFGPWKLLKFTKNQNSESLKLPKLHFWTVWICLNLISRKIWVTVNSQISTKSRLNFTFWKFLEHSALESAFLKSLNKLSIWSCAIRTCSDASIVILWRFCKRHLSLISNARHLLLISSTKKFIILHIAKNKYIIPIVVALVLFRMSVWHGGSFEELIANYLKILSF